MDWPDDSPRMRRAVDISHKINTYIEKVTHSPAFQWVYLNGLATMCGLVSYAKKHGIEIEQALSADFLQSTQGKASIVTAGVTGILALSVEWYGKGSQREGEVKGYVDASSSLEEVVSLERNIYDSLVHPPETLPSQEDVSTSLGELESLYTKHALDGKKRLQEIEHLACKDLRKRRITLEREWGIWSWYESRVDSLNLWFPDPDRKETSRSTVQETAKRYVTREAKEAIDGLSVNEWIPQHRTAKGCVRAEDETITNLEAMARTYDVVVPILTRARHLNTVNKALAFELADVYALAQEAGFEAAKQVFDAVRPTLEYAPDVIDAAFERICVVANDYERSLRKSKEISERAQRNAAGVL